MSSRDTVLQRIRDGLRNAAAAGFDNPAPPPVPEVWPRTTCDPAALADRFSAELKAVFGEPVCCPTMDDARRHFVELTQAAGWAKVGVVDHPACRELAAALPAEQVAWVTPDWQAGQIAELPAGLVAAECLLADTGTCMIDCPTAAARLMCYLPPQLVVVANREQLAEHLPAAWPRIAPRCAEPGATGEIVFVTGPSRTSDIEKILILGVHGPQRLVVLLVG
jgi:L-lactate dehydrogenase complex protein LldG